MLEKATDTLYSVFSKYFLRGSLRERSCDCCVSDDDILHLLSRPLREIDEHGIYWFMTKAMTTFGDVEDYKHFLPRILELMQIADYSFIDDFTIFEKLNYAEWRNWKEEEVQAIEEYFIALWIQKIKDESASFETIRTLLEIVETYVGIDKALSIWEQHASNQSILFIVDFVWNNYNFRSDAKKDLLYDWFSNEPIKEKIYKLFFETEDEVTSTKLSVVYSMLDEHKKLY